MADINLSEMTDAQLDRTNNDDLRAAMTTAGIAFETDDNKSDLISKIKAHYVANPPAPVQAAEQPASGDGWGGMHAAEQPASVPPAAAADGAHNLPPADAVAGAEPENNGPGQGRVEAPPGAVPADAAPGAQPQANANTPDHHDASAAGSGPGGKAPDAETAARTGAPIAEHVNEAGEEIVEGPLPPSVEHANALASRDIGADFDPSHRAREASALPRTDTDEQPPELGTAEIEASDLPDFGEMLRTSTEIDARLAATKAPPAQPGTFVLPTENTQLIVPDGANEKGSDAVGSTHDAAGNPVVKHPDPAATAAPDGSGEPVYVGTALPVERPEAAWRGNTA